MSSLRYFNDLPDSRQRGKRHIAIDTDGRLQMVKLATADISDSAGARMIFDAIRKRWLWLKHFFFPKELLQVLH